MKKEPKILTFDIENCPMQAWIWQQKTEYVPDNMIKKEWIILCWSAKWLGEKKVISSALPDYKAYYKKNKFCDKKILADLWKLLDEADIVVGHNVKRFDIRKANARFIMNGMKPPSPYKVVDTLQIARNKFMFTGNKLNNLAIYLGLGKKLDTGGFQLWLDCIAGKQTAWKKMVKYCEKDVVLTEKVYLKLLPYITNHPNLANFVNVEDPVCPNCGSDKLHKRGFARTAVQKYQRYQCQSCGAWSRANDKIGNKIERKSIN